MGGNVAAEFDIHIFDAISPKLPKDTQISLKSLPLLDAVTMQLLRFLTTNSLPIISELVSEMNSDVYRHEYELYRCLLDLFIKLRSIYNSEATLLTVSHILPGLWKPYHSAPSFIQSHESYILLVIRKVNVCSFLLTLLNQLPFGFKFLDDTFIEIFCSSIYDSKLEDVLNDDNTKIVFGKLLKPQAVLYLDLKTQCFISALQEDNISRSKEEIVNTILPFNIVETLKNKTVKINGRETPSQLQFLEDDFIQRYKRRKISLLASESLKELIQKYDWADCCKQIFDYVTKKIGLLIYGKRGRVSINSLYDDVLPTTLENITASETASQNLNSTSLPEDKSGSEANGVSNNVEDLAGKSTPESNDMNVLKNKPKQKRMWTKEEEQTLVIGLKTCGPSWSKILSLYGPGGSMSETLKNRSQVQLKDKARNWKMHYLKSGSPIPDYLLKVTGDLEREEKSRKKTRGKRFVKKL